MQFLGLGYGSLHAFCTAGQYQFGPQGFEQGAAFDTHRLRHGQDEMISFRSRNKGQSYAGVSAGGFYQGGTRLQQSALFSILNHSQCHAVLYAASGVEILQFNQNPGFQLVFLYEVVKLQKWSVAYQFGQAFCYFRHDFFTLVIHCILFLSAKLCCLL